MRGSGENFHSLKSHIRLKFLSFPTILYFVEPSNVSVKLKVNSYLWKPISQTFGWLLGRVTINSMLTQLQLALTTGQSQSADSIKWQSHHHSVHLLSDNWQHTMGVNKGLLVGKFTLFCGKKRGRKKIRSLFRDFSIQDYHSTFHCSFVDTWEQGLAG